VSASVTSSTPVAIVGIGCRLPGGIVDPTSFVRFLAERGDGIVAVPPDRWSQERFFDPDPDVPGRTYTAHGGFLQHDVFAFEPEPFGISPREAASLDPQQALLLEIAWEALEDAGIPVDQLAGSATGVYVGSFGLDNQLYRMWGAGRRSIDQHVNTAVTATMMSARLAYTFDLRGPTLTVDTACSSSLVAIHLACRALRDGECDAALAGGAHVMVVPGMMITLAKGRFAAADGRSKAFDANGDGYGRGEGAAVVVLKRLSTALAHGDRIHGVVLGSAINQDGRTDGITVPSGAAQEALMRRACVSANISPAQVGYVEAHGTGTPVGDPIEARALGSVYGRAGHPAQPCLIGSVKTNIGHLEAAAGVVGVVKACLMLCEGRVLPQLGPSEVNPELELEANGLKIATEEQVWPAERPLAAVNSFGYGGTNAHLILAPPPEPVTASTPMVLPALTPVPISAYADAALRARAGDLIRWLEEHGKDDVGDVAFTLARRRSHLPARACLLSGSQADLQRALEALRDGREVPEVVKGVAPAGPAPKVAWVFTGMGPQRAGMARELLAEEPVFRREVEACDALFRELSGWSILEVLADPAQAERLRRNDVAQVANFVVQAGLIALLESLGARPDGVIGHSVGEVGAAYAAGMLSRPDAVLLVHHRARVSQSAAGRGTMLAAGVSAEEATFLIEPDDDVCVAALNGPRSVTLAGDRAALAKVAQVLDQLGAFQRAVPVEVAYHSAHIEPMRDELLRRWAPVRPNAPRVALYSSVTGAGFDGESHDAAYWWRNLREPVRFVDAARAMISDGYRIFLEVGPHPVLATYLRELLDESGAQGQTLHTLKRDQPERLQVRRAVAALHCSGARIDWSALHGGGRQVSLPLYPWQRAVHWTETPAMRTERLAADYEHPFLQTRLPTPHPSWTAWLEGSAAAYLRDHRVQNVPIAPAAFYAEAGLALARALDPGARVLVLRRLRFHKPLPLQADTLVWVRAEGDGRFEVHSRTGEGDAWTMHASGERASGDAARMPEAEPLAALQRRAMERVEVDWAYETMGRRKMQYGPAFRTVRELRLGPGEALAELELPDLPAQARYKALLPTPLLDGAFQSVLALLGAEGGAVVVSGVGQLSLRRPAGTRLVSYTRITERDDRGLTAQVSLYDHDGELVAQLDDVKYRTVDAVDPLGEAKRWLYAERWERLDAQGDLPGGGWAFYGGSGLAARLVERLQRQHRSASHRPALDGAGPLPDPLAAHHVVVLDDLEDMFAVLSGVGAFAHRLAEGGWSELTLVTCGAVQAHPDDTVSPAMHACWGFARALERELSPLRLRLIDAAPGSDLDTLASALCVDGEDEVAVRGKAAYTARLERLDLASLRTAVDPAASCVAWSPTHGWVSLPSPRRPDASARRVRIEQVVVFPAEQTAQGLSSSLAVSTAVDLATRERGVVISQGPPPTELCLEPSAFWTPERVPAPGQLVGAVGRYVAHRLLRAPAGGAVWVAPSLPWLSAWLDAAGVPCVRDVADGDSPVCAIALSNLAELEPGLLRRCAEAGVIGVVSPPGEVPSFWGALPTEWAVTRLDVCESLVHAPQKLKERLLAPANDAMPVRRFEELGSLAGPGPQAFEVSSSSIDALDARTLRVAPQDTWWITGGTRGFGLAIAQWLLERGAKRLILSSRTGQLGDAERARLQTLGGAEARIEICALDMGDGDAVKTFVDALQERGLSPTAIVHAAAHYEDAPVEQLDRGMFERVFRAKALGAWHLHEATRELPVDHFILCSSVTALLGNAVQTAYAAANAYLDGLAALRRSQGLAARSIAWGALLDVGILARAEATALDVEASGLRRMRARDAWEVLASVPPTAPANVAVFDGDWRQLFRALRLPSRARWGALEPLDRGVASADRVASMLRGVEPGRHMAVLEIAVRDEAAAVLRTAAEQIDPARPLRDYGLDSLLAVELRVVLDSHLGVDVTTMEILASASARDLARAVLRVRSPN
jgi:acyl transferase domain-containing protein/NADP-dependent 3-hydroxy acid dehydrogenase YdfG/acyl carrier protein